jgi:hypothetical protein
MSNVGRWLAALGLLISPLAACLRPATGDPADLASRVVLLANASDPDSILLAREYARRGAFRLGIS